MVPDVFGRYFVVFLRGWIGKRLTAIGIGDDLPVGLSILHFLNQLVRNLKNWLQGCFEAMNSSHQLAR
jgi:hypothetical protein